LYNAPPLIHHPSLHFRPLTYFPWISKISLQGKGIAITGGASGIGLSTATLISARGAMVCIADISVADLTSAEAHFSSLSVPFMTTNVDVSNRKEVDAWIDKIVATYAKIDGAVNCAGIV
jgi:NAD(P)-dependent dehydrogenase (short-subunit alcohol dehydrogenase family)